MVIYTVMQAGENWTGYELVDFGVKHGNVALGNVSKFTTYSKAEGWQGSLGASGDNAYTQESWKLFTQANDGFIFEFVAKYPVKVSIVKEQVGGDWVDATNLNIYKKNGSELSTVKTVALNANTPAADYGVEVDLAKGETLYWEFVFEWTAHRNMINLPKATITYLAPHECDFSGEYSHDEEGHWHECSCGLVDEKEAHKGGKATITEKAVCEVCGASYGEVLNSVVTIYFQNNWLWSDVCFYAWNDKGNIGEWPGVKMPLVGTNDGKELYAIELDIAQYPNYIINGLKDDGSGNRDQTPDIKAIDLYEFYATEYLYMAWDNGNKVGHWYLDPAVTHFHNIEVSKHDETHHWLECSCGFASEKAEHVYTDWNEISAATCTEAQVLKAVCSCGHEATKEGIAALGHKHETVYVNGYKVVKCACGDEASKEAWLTHVVTQNITNVEITKGEGEFTITFTVAKGWSGLHLYYNGQELTPDNVEEGYEVYPNDCSLGVYWSEGSWFVYSGDVADYTVIYTPEGSVLSQPEPEVVPGFSYKVVQNITNVEGVEKDGIVTITFTATGVWCGLHLYYDGIELTASNVVVGEGVSATYAACIYWDGDTSSWFLQNTSGADASYTLLYDLTSKSLAQPHAYGSWVEGVSATCTKAGSKAHYECTLCGKYFDVQYNVIENIVIEALGHTEVVDAAVAATCTEAGLTEGKHCSVCNEVLVAQESVEALGHTEVVDAAVSATCTEAGKTEGKHCSVCNEVLVAQTEVAAKGHTEVIDAAVAPTCTSKGKTEGKHCSECNEVLVAQEEVDMLEHVYADSNNACDSCGKELGVGTPEPKPTPSTNGCGGSILASIFGLLTLTGATIVLRKKREE